MLTYDYGVKNGTEKETDIRKEKSSAYAGANDSDHWIYNKYRD